MALVIETRSSHGSVSRTHLRAGTTRVVVRPGDTFRLYDEDTGKAPSKAVVKQLDNSILVDNLADGAQGADQPQALELLGFYSSCSVSSPCHLELPDTTSGTVDITPATGAIGALSDGSFAAPEPNARTPFIPILHGKAFHVLIAGLRGTVSPGMAVCRPLPQVRQPDVGAGRLCP